VLRRVSVVVLVLRRVSVVVPSDLDAIVRLDGARLQTGE